MSDHLPPTREILNAFHLSGTPTLLEGGEGTCYRVGDIVLKPIKNVAEASWIAEMNNALVCDAFRVPTSHKAKDGSWVYQNWTACTFLAGEHRSTHYAEALALSEAFHQVLRHIPKPAWMDEKTDIFAQADRSAWGETPLPSFEPAMESFARVFRVLKENRLPFQVIHGDWNPDQLLFHETFPPAVLDMTPYYRPAAFPIADMLVSAMIHDQRDISIMNLGKDISDFDQLVLRAWVFRICSYIGFQIHPENDYDWKPTIRQYTDLVGPLLNFFASN